jgi:sulfur-carrier protein
VRTGRREAIAASSIAVAKVELTKHLFTFFPQLEGKELVVEASTVADVVRAMETIAPGFAFYVCDERGRLRRHVNIFVDELSVGDRARLSDPVQPTSRVFILQALSGG